SAGETPPMLQSVADVWSRPVADAVHGHKLHVAPGQAIASRRRKSTASARPPSWLCVTWRVDGWNVNAQPTVRASPAARHR
nr:hypothetical protein [Tanacetum cinerariifolium]